MKRKQLTKKDLQYIVENWDQPIPIADIAKKLGFTETSIIAYVGIMRKLGIEVPRRIQTGNRMVLQEFAQEWKKLHKKK